jgi:hypothetical protein
MNAIHPQYESIPMRCLICEKQRLDGIHVCDQFICSICESEMVRTDVRDEKYHFFIHQMKRAWYKKDA